MLLSTGVSVEQHHKAKASPSKLESVGPLSESRLRRQSVQAERNEMDFRERASTIARTTKSLGDSKLSRVEGLFVGGTNCGGTSR